MKTLPSNSIFIEGIGPDETIKIVRELRALGLVQGKDFDFKYQKAIYDYYGDTQPVPCGANFYLYEGKWATYFSLRYAT